jgi:hypothetical protein
MIFTRRRFCTVTAALLASRPSLAGTRPAPMRKMIFLFCRGGWDPSMVFAPALDNPAVDTEAGAVAAEAGGITFVDSIERPSVRRFFERWGSQAAVINGLEVRSITHDRCTRLMLTGALDGAADDWPAILAADAGSDVLLPHLVMSGPSFTDRYTNKVVRMGSSHQFSDLLSGDALTASDMRISAPSAADEARARDFLKQQVTRFEETIGKGTRFGQSYGQVLEQLAELESIRDEIGLDASSTTPLCHSDPLGEMSALLRCFELGVARTGMVRYDGWCANGWDTHSQNSMQSRHFEELFWILDQLMDMLQTSPGTTGGTMLEEVSVMVFSDMGRHPRLNVSMGKDHWTFTSAMLMGAGIAGGQVVGEMDEDFRGHPVDLASGAATSSGTALTPEHIGATLLALGDIDPSTHLPGISPIEALLA